MQNNIPKEIEELVTKIQIVPRGTICNFITYFELLKKWNPKINLVAKSTIDDFWNRHLLDSLQLYKYIANPQTKILIDLGSGAGFPGMVLAMMGFKQVHLIESDTRKCAFLQQVALETKADVQIHNARIENVLCKGDIVTARALSALPTLLPLAQEKLNPNGVCLFLKGENYGAEIDAAQKQFHFDLQCYDSATEPKAKILEIKNIK